MLALVPRVVDALWAAFEPQLPEREEPVHPLGCHRPRIADRDVFEAIVLRLVTGCSWDVAGRLGKGGETTLRTPLQRVERPRRVRRAGGGGHRGL